MTDYLFAPQAADVLGVAYTSFRRRLWCGNHKPDGKIDGPGRQRFEVSKLKEWAKIARGVSWYEEKAQKYINMNNNPEPKKRKKRGA